MQQLPELTCVVLCFDSMVRFAPEMLRQQSYSFNLDLFGIGLILFRRESMIRSMLRAHGRILGGQFMAALRRLLAGYEPFDPPSCFTQLEFDERRQGLDSY